MRRSTGIAGTLTALALAGCGSTATAVRTTPAAHSVTYDNPHEMLSVLVTGGFDCDDSQNPQAAYNVYGALSLSCFHGPEQETVYLDVYKTPSAEKNAQNAGETGSEVGYYGNGWEVTAESPDTLVQAQKILTAKQ